MVVTGVSQDKKGGPRSFSSSKLAVLRKHPMFCDLDPEALDQLCRYAKHSSLKRGATIVSKGDPGNSLIAVISGTVKISVSSPDGRSAILNLIGPGGLASALLRLTEKDKLAPGGRTIAITQQEISEMVGMTRESINKQLRAWAARKWVRLEHGAIVVLKAQSLQSLVDAGSDDDGE